MPDRLSPLAPFRHDTFRSIWLASLASNFGGLIQAVGAGWMMTSISDSVNMFIHNRLHKSVDGYRIGNVDLGCGRPPSSCQNLGSDSFGVVDIEVGDNGDSPCGGKLTGKLPPNPLTGARDQNHAIGEAEIPSPAGNPRILRGLDFDMFGQLLSSQGRKQTWPV